MFAISSELPILFKGCLSELADTLSVEFKNLEAKGVFVIEGAIAFTLILGANSADKDLVRPSIAPLEAATCVW